MTGNRSQVHAVQQPMNPLPSVAGALLLFAAACGNGGPVTRSMTADRPSVPIDTQPTVDRAAQCVSTDPAWRPISVHRAVNCPDGTLVTVQGILVHDAHRATTLCDVVTATGDRCVGDGLSLKGAVDSPVLAAAVGKVIFTGVVSGHVLQLVSPADGRVAAARSSRVSRPSAPLRWA